MSVLHLVGGKCLSIGTLEGDRVAFYEFAGLLFFGVSYIYSLRITLVCACVSHDP